MKSLFLIQKRILVALIDNQSILEEDLHNKLKSFFPDLSIDELRKALKELANDWRYIYAHETSWGYKVELNPIGEREAKKLGRAYDKGKNHINKDFYHILVWPNENVLTSDPEIEGDLTFEDCREIIRDIRGSTTFFLNGRKRRADRVTRYEVYKTEKKMSVLSKEDPSFVKRSDYNLITTFGEKVTRDLTRQASLKTPSQRCKKATAFLSASFNSEIDDLIAWFIKIIKSMGIDVIWLKEKYEPRPTEAKIKENIQLCNCFIQIITRDVTEKGKEAGWIGNEIAWARESSPNGNMAIFVEKGAKATGLAEVIADNLVFDPKNLEVDASRIVQFLTKLKEKVLSS